MCKTQRSSASLRVLRLFLPLQNNTEAAKAAFAAASRKQHHGRKNHAPLLAQAAVELNAGNISRAHQL